MIDRSKLSPMMKNYMETKEQYEDCILFYRLGDFYEMFFDDAVRVSKELELTLTGKQCGLEERAPMCGVPFHAADTYVAKLVEKGYKVAICEQVEDPATAKGLVKREVIKIVTPGTLTSSSMLKENENNYLASIYADGDGFGISYCDISTGETYATEVKSSDYTDELINELVKIGPSEIIYNASSDEFIDMNRIRKFVDVPSDAMKDGYYKMESTENALKRQFRVGALTGIGLDEKKKAALALGAMISYFLETQKQSLGQITGVNVYEIGTCMALDKATIRNLEITETLYEKSVKGSLLGVLDKTNTAMGSRLMKRWLKEPLNRADQIKARLDAVETILDNVLIRNNIRECLKQIYDFYRLSGRIASGNANGKDMTALKNSIAVLPDLKACLEDLDNSLLTELNEQIDSLKDVYDLISSSINEDCPFTIKEGGIILPGYSSELDVLKDSIKDAQEWIAKLDVSEKERTGIKNLKVGFNKVFGYYIEVSKSNYDLVPENYIRKQTLVNAERFITPELKEMEGLVLNAEAKINSMEYELFTDIREKIGSFIVEIQNTATAIAAVDVLTSFAQVSASNGYIKPKIDNSDVISIKKGRHPVIEQFISDGVFVSNDLYMDKKDASMLLITGPNMAGKSTYMRQTAIIVLMAQAGCFVPCESCRIGIADRIFTRIGASDNLAAGQSTFFVEMSELAYILNSATERSLIILDEIGRGTSTYDGLSIAWAATEYLCNDNFKARTLFATHYHELTALADEVEGITNLNVDVTEENGNIVFLHKIIPGSTSRSYGIHVAKLAGVPRKLLERADEKLTELETGVQVIIVEEEAPQEMQISLFQTEQTPLTDKIRSIDLMETTPSQALRILEELKEALEK